METLRNSPGTEKAQIFSLSRFQRIILRVSATSQVHFHRFHFRFSAVRLLAWSLRPVRNARFCSYSSCFRPLSLGLRRSWSDFFVSEVRLLSWLRAFRKFCRTVHESENPEWPFRLYQVVCVTSTALFAFPHSPCSKLTHILDVYGVLCSLVVFPLGTFFTFVHPLIQSDPPLFKNSFNLTSPFNFLLFYSEHLCYDLSGQCGHWQEVAL